MLIRTALTSISARRFISLLPVLAMVACGGGGEVSNNSTGAGGEPPAVQSPPIVDTLPPNSEPPATQSPPTNVTPPAVVDPEGTETAFVPVRVAALNASTCGATDERSVALIVDQKFDGALTSELSRLEADIARDLGVCVKKLTVSDTDSAKSIRAFLQVLRKDNGLQGAVLIGDVPAASIGDYAGYLDIPPTLTDSYYEVLSDALWIDANKNNVFDRTFDLDGDGTSSLVLDAFSDARDRDVWTGRLTPPKAHVLSVRVEQLRRYLDRNHAYRTGSKVYEPRMLYMNTAYRDSFPGDQTFNEAAQQSDAEAMYSASRLFSRDASAGLMSVWNDNMTLQRKRWSQEMQAPVTYAYVNTHGTASSQAAVESKVWTEVVSGDLALAPYRGLLLDFVSCSNGDFSVPDYFAGNALFLGESLAVRAFTSTILVAGRGGAPMSVRLLGSGLTLGEIKKQTALPDSYTIFGDPTLRLRPRTGLLGSVPVVATFEFPPISASYEASQANPNPVRTLRLRNTGTKPILIRRSEQTAATSWNARGTLNRSVLNPQGYLQGIEPSFSESSGLGRLEQPLAPGESVELKIYFVKDFAGSKPGLYQWLARFDTDDPDMPVFEVRASQTIH